MTKTSWFVQPMSFFTDIKVIYSIKYQLINKRLIKPGCSVNLYYNIMGNNNRNKRRLDDKLLKVKIDTLKYYLPKEEVEKYVGCDFEFYITEGNNIPIDLHTWVGNNHNYQERYHRSFPVPEHLKIPLIKMKKTHSIGY